MKQYEQHINWQYRTGTTTKKWEKKEEITPGSRLSLLIVSSEAKY